MKTNKLQNALKCDLITLWIWMLHFLFFFIQSVSSLSFLYKVKYIVNWITCSHHLLCGDHNISSWAEFEAVCSRRFAIEFTFCFKLNAGITIGGGGWDFGIFGNKFVVGLSQVGASGPRWRWEVSVGYRIATIFVNDRFDRWWSCCWIVDHMHFHCEIDAKSIKYFIIEVRMMLWREIRPKHSNLYNYR